MEVLAIPPITLTEEDDARARRLHAEAFVFDFAPYGEPMPRTERTTAAIASAREAGGDLSKVLSCMWSEHLRELDDSPAARQEREQEWRRSGVSAVQVTLGGMELAIYDWDAVLRDAARWYRREAIGGMRVCTTAAQLRQARDDGQVGVLMGLQDTLSIGSDLDRLETLHGLGVRVVQLTYNRRNLVGDGCTERHQSGLSRFGVDLVRELNRLGIVVDVSHCGIDTTIEAIQSSDRPVAFTHTTCRALFDHPRGKTDEQLRLLAEHDGYVGIAAVPYFFRPGDGADIDDMMDHLVHAAELVGVDRVGIATDVGFWSTDFPDELHEQAMHGFRALGFRPEDGLELGGSLGEFVHWRDWPHITRGLVARGFGDDEIRGILGANWLRFLERVR